MNNEQKKVTFVLFGASGHLSKKYLLPALESLKINPIKISRKDYPNLKQIIPRGGELVFHLAIPPEGVADAIKIIAENFAEENSENIKILLEKPFGTDLKSAERLIEFIDKYFREEQIYRVDHYLAKKSLQNLVGQNENIKAIEIIGSEEENIEGRVNFYEKTGALRDSIQSHMLEMVAVTLSGSFEREKREEIIKNISIICDITKNECVKRGQYKGYREEVGNPGSMTETFVSVNLALGDVGITLTTGKALREKLTQIKVIYKDGSEKIFNIVPEPDAYAKVLQATIAGNHHPFMSQKEVLESWRILEDIQETWKSGGSDLIIYERGTPIEELTS